MTIKQNKKIIYNPKVPIKKTCSTQHPGQCKRL